MNKGLIIACFFVGVLSTLLVFPEGFVSVAVAVIAGLIMGVLLKLLTDDKEDIRFIVHLFVGALLVRVLFGFIAFRFDFWEYFAGDAKAYGEWGQVLADHLWNGTSLDSFATHRFYDFRGTGWGMYWLIGFIYLFTGENPTAGNCFFAVFGAATAPLSFLCTKKLFNNTNVAKIASLLVAFMPGFINWSSFMMKDGVIIFVLVLTFYSLIKLQEKFSVTYFAVLLGCFLVIISLRFYIFPMLATASLGSLLIGYKETNSIRAVIQRFALIIAFGVTLTYVGAVTSVQSDVERYGTLKSLNNARLDQSQASSGYNEGVDVSTSEGAIAFFPTGFAYLMLAPFPWQMTSIRSALTLPEMLLWWMLIPFGITGIFYSLKNNFRRTLPILIFSLMLTIGYSIFQGNVGTAYRQRTQIQIFYFIFIAVGWTLSQEKRENRKILDAINQQQMRKNLEFRT